MFAKYLTAIRELPARSNQWSGRLGPVSLVGYSHGAPRSASNVLSYMYEQPCQSDFYADIQFHDKAPIEQPSDTGQLLPVLRCGAMTVDDHLSVTAASREEWYSAMREVSAQLTEKGYIPVSAGGDGVATQAMVEGYKHVFPSDEVVLLHFSAHPTVHQKDAPLRVLLEKGLLQGVVSIGNRCVCAEDRKMRKQFRMFYLDMHSIYAKGIHTIQDLRNDYPVFLSINADVLDPIYAPAVDRPVPGGLSTRALLHLLTAVRGPKVIGVDVHGYQPSLDICRPDGVGLTQMAMAKVVKETIVKAYSISPITEAEANARIQMLRQQGVIPENYYPEH